MRLAPRELKKDHRPVPMLNLVLLMQAGIVAGACLPHSPKDFEPALAQTPESAGVGLTAFSKALIIDVGSRAGASAQVSPRETV